LPLLGAARERDGGECDREHEYSSEPHADSFPSWLFFV
jgi:hypothetical protein